MTTVALRARVTLPGRPRPSRRYVVTIDLEHDLPPDAWPYPEEEYPLTCLLDTRPVFDQRPIGDPTVIVHRFGGSYEPARFVLTAADSAATGAVRLRLVNRSGLTVESLELGEVRVAETDDGAGLAHPLAAEGQAGRASEAPRSARPTADPETRGSARWPSPDESTDRRFALLVACGEPAATEVPSLERPHANAEALRAALVDGPLAFPAANVRTLADPSRDALVESLASLKGTAPDLVVLYLCGWTRETDQGAVLLSRGGQSTAVEEIARLLRAAGAARHVVIAETDVSVERAFPGDDVALLGTHGTQPVTEGGPSTLVEMLCAALVDRDLDADADGRIKASDVRQRLRAYGDGGILAYDVGANDADILLTGLHPPLTDLQIETMLAITEVLETGGISPSAASGAEVLGRILPVEGSSTDGDGNAAGVVRRFNETYFRPAFTAASANGVESALGVAILLDTAVHLGPATLARLLGALESRHADLVTLTEARWLERLLFERRDQAGRPMERSRRPLDVFQTLLTGRNLALDLPIEVLGVSIDETALRREPPAPSAADASESVTAAPPHEQERHIRALTDAWQSVAMAYHVQHLPGWPEDDAALAERFALSGAIAENDFEHVRCMTEFVFSKPVRDFLVDGTDPCDRPLEEREGEWSDEIAKSFSRREPTYGLVEIVRSVRALASADERSLLEKHLGMSIDELTERLETVWTAQDADRGHFPELIDALARPPAAEVAVRYLLPYAQWFLGKRTSYTGGDGFPGYLDWLLARWRGIVEQYARQADPFAPVEMGALPLPAIELLEAPPYSAPIARGETVEVRPRGEDEATPALRWSVDLEGYVRLVRVVCDEALTRVRARLDAD